MTVLRVENVTKALPGQSVLRGVDLVVEPGTITALLGASGCGKTTLLRLIAGFSQADTGRVLLGERVVDGPEGVVPAERRKIGYVPQDGSLFPHLSVRGNIGFGLTRAERGTRRIDEMLELTGLEGLGDRKPHELSGGQQQRTALARALAPNPHLILLDEPFNALDRALRASVCADVVALLRASGTTAILVTHDPLEAFATADRIAVMTAGVVAQHDDPARIYQRPCNPEVARLTGSAIFIDGTAAGDRVETPLGRLPAWPGGASTGPVHVMLRPEQIVPDAAGVAARPIAAVFNGAHYSLTAGLGGLELALQWPGTEPIGETVRLGVTGRCVSYPRAAGSIQPM